MFKYLKKYIFCTIILMTPYLNLPSKAMYEELVKEEIRLTTRLTKVQPCVHAKSNVKIKDRLCSFKDNDPRQNPSGLICSEHGNEAKELRAKLEATKLALQPFRDKQEDEALLRKLQIAKAQAELALITNPKK
jgi:hypothetical protein